MKNSYIKKLNSRENKEKRIRLSLQQCNVLPGPMPPLPGAAESLGSLASIMKILYIYNVIE